MSDPDSIFASAVITGTGGVDKGALEALIQRARREIDAGLLPAAQLALARNGKIVANVALGDATIDTRFAIFSATKPFVASVALKLIADGHLDVKAKVTDYFSEWASDEDAVKSGAPGKADVTVEQIMTHTCGFPGAPMNPKLWSDRNARVAKMGSWRLAWEPGTRFEYHASSSMWVLAEIIDQILDRLGAEPTTGLSATRVPATYVEALETWLTKPMGLPRLLGFAPDHQDNIAPLVGVGEPATPDELEQALGVRELPPTEVTAEAIVAFNHPKLRAGAMPGGGGIGRASDVALFYQELLHNRHGVFDSEVLADMTGNIRVDLPDPCGVPASRTIGLVIAGDDGQGHIRGLGRTVSSSAFGHNGAGGQLAWADPETGLSFCYLTSGYDLNDVRRARRGVALSSLAALCAAD